MLPPPEFRAEANRLEAAYLESDDPIVQSGFSGGPERWVAERSPLMEAITRHGTFLDVGCANGLLAEDVVRWAGWKGIVIEPHGIDLGSGLVALAQQRHRAWSSNFQVADAWSWDPSMRWTFVYSLLDLSPAEMWCEWLQRLSSWVQPGGRLIIGDYGSRSRSIPPVDVAGVFEKCGLEATGSSHGGDPVLTRFAWADC